MPADQNPRPAKDPTPGEPSPRALRLLVRGLLEQWKDRAFGLIDSQSSDLPRAPGAVDIGEQLERLRIFGFLQRTDPRLLVEPEWTTLRESIEQSMSVYLENAQLRARVLAALDLVERRVARELGERIMRADALRRRMDADEREPRSTRPSRWKGSLGRGAGGERPRLDPRTDPDADLESIASLETLRELDGLMLATAATLRAVPRRDVDPVAPTGDREGESDSANEGREPAVAATPAADRYRRLHAIAMQAARSGESFDAMDGWFAATERTIDPLLRQAAESLAIGGLEDAFVESLPPSEQALASSAAWIAVSRARIRMYRLEQQDARDEARAESLRREGALALTVLTDLVAGAESNPDRWTLVGEGVLPDRLGKIMEEPAGLGAATALVFRLADELRPLRAAARGFSVDARISSLDWTDERSGAKARCIFAKGQEDREGSSELVIRLFDDSGEPTAAFDGQSASWLGISVTIANARAIFSAAALRDSASPVDVLQRVGGLFIGGMPWTPGFETIAPEAETIDELDMTDEIE